MAITNNDIWNRIDYVANVLESTLTQLNNAADGRLNLTLQRFDLLEKANKARYKSLEKHMVGQFTATKKLHDTIHELEARFDQNACDHTETICKRLDKITQMLHAQNPHGMLTGAGNTTLAQAIDAGLESPHVKLEIPAGWKVDQGIEGRPHVHAKGCYIYHDPNITNLPERYHGWTPFNGAQWGKIHTIISQTINIDLDKQPTEFIAWAMNENGDWKAHKSIPRCHTLHWADRKKKTTNRRILVDSECPDYDGDWKDSLLVRPEALNP